MADVVDKQRNKLFRELIRAVVVGTVGDHGGHAVGVVERPHKMVAGGLGGTVRRVRLIFQVLREELLPVGQVMLAAGCLGGERRLNPLRMRHLQRPIHLVGGNVVETAGNCCGGRKLVFRKALRKIISFRLFFRSFGHRPSQGPPDRLCSLQEAQGAHHIGLRKRERILDGTVHVTLCGKVNDAVYLLFLHETEHPFKVTDVHLYKLVIGLVLNILEVGKVPRVSEFVQVNNVILRVFVHKQAHHMRANEARTARDDNRPFHLYATGIFTTTFLTGLDSPSTARQGSWASSGNTSTK